MLPVSSVAREDFERICQLGSRIGAIIPVAHGAAAALLHHGHLVRAPLDYEWPGVAQDRAHYDAQRDSSEVTGSPALPAGLNLGIQLHWLESLRLRD